MPKKKTGKEQTAKKKTGKEQTDSVTQSWTFPQNTLEEAIRVAQAIEEKNAGVQESIDALKEEVSQVDGRIEEKNAGVPESIDALKEEVSQVDGRIEEAVAQASTFPLFP